VFAEEFLTVGRATAEESDECEYVGSKFREAQLSNCSFISNRSSRNEHQDRIFNRTMRLYLSSVGWNIMVAKKAAQSVGIEIVDLWPQGVAGEAASILLLPHRCLCHRDETRISCLRRRLCGG
jgi:hypothetical protein